MAEDMSLKSSATDEETERSRERPFRQEAVGAERGASPRSTGHLVDRAFWLAVVAAILPVAVAAVRGCLQDWAPVSDDGLIAVRSFDVLTRHPPLLGMWSSASLWSRVQFNLPGPLEFGLLAVPVHVLGHRIGTALGMATVNVAALVATAVLARRRGGSLLGLGTMLFVVSLEWSMGSEFLYDPWPVNSAPFIFVLFLFAAWSVADGDMIALPVLALSASYLVQTHLSYVIIVPVVGVLAVSALAMSLRRHRRNDPDGWPILKRRARIGLASTALLAVVLWAPPLYQQFTHHPGNLSLLAKASRAKPPSPPDARAAVKIVGSTVALPPWWLPPSYGSPSFDYAANGRPLLLAAAGIVVLTAAGAALARLAVRRRDRTSTALLTIAGGTLLAGLATAYKSPTPYGYNPNYLRWLWPTSMFCWFAVAAAAVRLTDDARLIQWRRQLVLGLVSVVLVVSVLALPKVDNGASPHSAGPITDGLAKRALPQLGDQSPVLLQVRGSDHGDLAINVAFTMPVNLQRRGTAFVVDDETLMQQLGDARRWNGHNAKVILRVDSDRSAPKGFRRVASYYGLSKPEQLKLARLGAEIRQSLIDTGGVRLSAIGMRLVAGSDRRSRFFAHIFEHLRSLAGKPESLMADDAFDGILSMFVTDHGERGVFLSTGALGDGTVMRWAQLSKRSKAERVSIDVAPAPQPEL